MVLIGREILALQTYMKKLDNKYQLHGILIHINNECTLGRTETIDLQ